jgi:hypothetical protein
MSNIDEDREDEGEEVGALRHVWLAARDIYLHASGRRSATRDGDQRRRGGAASLHGGEEMEWLRRR